MTNEMKKGLIEIEKISQIVFLSYPNGYFHKKGRNLLVRETFFTYFCRSTNKMKDYEHKTEKIYLARG